MGFKLPNGSDLSAEQINIINLPLNRNWVIQGDPGTGKTVMAIYRAGQIGPGKKTLMLVYNRPLREFLAAATTGRAFRNCEVKTYHRWLNSFYSSYFKMKPSYIKADRMDWDRIEMDFRSVPTQYDHIIVDEGQDFPDALIRIIGKISKNITCFVDPNQSIEPGKTNINNVIKELCVEAPFSLTRNFRNTREIRALSAVYCNGRKTAKAEIPGKKPVFIKCDDYDDQTEKMCRIIERNKEKTIGVIVNSKNLNRTAEEIYDELYEDIEVQMYKSMTDKNIDFDRKGVQIVSYGTMKGLEFDIVLLPRFEKVRSTGDESVDLNRIYVATSRPISELYAFYIDNYCTSKWIDTMGPLNNNQALVEWR